MQRLLQPWHVVVPVGEHVHVLERPQAVALPEHITRHLGHVFTEGRYAVGMGLVHGSVVVEFDSRNVLGRVDLGGVVLGLNLSFHLASNVNDVDVKCNILELQELLLRLLVQIELLELLGGVLVPMPGIAFEGVEEVVVCEDHVFICEEGIVGLIIFGVVGASDRGEGVEDSNDRSQLHIV